ncbi:hypothetical protein YC2023_116119 [Brassica napus]
MAVLNFTLQIPSMPSRVLRFGEDRAFLSFRLVVLPIGQSDSFFLREGGGVKRSRHLGFGYGGSQFYFADPVNAFGLEACGGVVDSLPVVVVFVVSKRVLRFGEDRAFLSFRLVVLPIGQSDSFFLREGGGNRRRLVHRGVVAVWWLHVCGVKRSRRLGFGYGGSQFYFADPVDAFGLEACGGVVDSLPVVVVFVVSKRVLRFGEDRASLSFRLVVLPIGQSDSFFLREGGGNRRRLVHRGVVAVWWLHVCGLARIAAVCSPEPASSFPSSPSRLGLAGVGVAILSFVIPVRGRSRSLGLLADGGSVAAVASACSFRVAFQALCGVNYKPGFGGFARSLGKYLDLPSIARLALHDSDGYKLRGLH